MKRDREPIKGECSIEYERRNIAKRMKIDEERILNASSVIASITKNAAPEKNMDMLNAEVLSKEMRNQQNNKEMMNISTQQNDVGMTEITTLSNSHRQNNIEMTKITTPSNSQTQKNTEIMMNMRTVSNLKVKKTSNSRTKKAKKKKMRVKKSIPPTSTRMKDVMYPVDDLGWGSSVLSLDHFDHSCSRSIQSEKKKKNIKRLNQLPKQHQEHLKAWVHQRKYEWNMMRQNDRLERMLGLSTQEMIKEDETNDIPLVSQLESVRVFKGGISVPMKPQMRSNYGSGEVIAANNYFRAAGGMNAVVTLCNVIKEIILSENDVSGMNTLEPCHFVNWNLVSEKMKLISDRWNPSFCRAIWQFIQLHRCTVLDKAD